MDVVLCVTMVTEYIKNTKCWINIIPKNHNCNYEHNIYNNIKEIIKHITLVKMVIIVLVTLCKKGILTHTHEHNLTVVFL